MRGTSLLCNHVSPVISKCHVFFLFRFGMDLRLALKNSPEMLRASHRTTTIFWPLRSCFATVLARRPSKWPLPSITTYFCDQSKALQPSAAQIERTTGSKDDMLSETILSMSKYEPRSCCRPPKLSAPSRTFCLASLREKVRPMTVSTLSS